MKCDYCGKDSVPCHNWLIYGTGLVACDACAQANGQASHALFSDLFALVNHCPPPGNVMLPMVEAARTLGLIEPELRPWIYLEPAGPLPPGGAATGGKLHCRCCDVGFGDRAHNVTLAAITIGHPEHLFFVGQCPECLRIFWGTTEERARRWQEAVEAEIPKDPPMFHGFPLVFKAIPGSPRAFNPAEPLCQKRARDPIGIARAAARWARVQSEQSRRGPAREPVFAL